MTPRMAFPIAVLVTEEGGFWPGSTSITGTSESGFGSSHCLTNKETTNCVCVCEFGACVWKF